MKFHIKVHIGGLRNFHYFIVFQVSLFAEFKMGIDKLLMQLIS